MDDRGHIEQHVTWHAGTKTLGPKHGSYSTADGLRAGFAEMRQAVELVAARTADDDYPTAKLPPITDSVGPRRRPPAGVRELRGAELLRALADELDSDDDVNGDDL
jgi:hypothetical protein